MWRLLNIRISASEFGISVDKTRSGRYGDITFKVNSLKGLTFHLQYWGPLGPNVINERWDPWSILFKGTQGLIYVLDSNDCERVNEAREELMKMLAEEELTEASLLILANKQDLPNAMNAAEITDKLGLHSLRNRNWYIQATCATSGDGLYEGLNWLSNQLKKAN